MLSVTAVMPPILREAARRPDVDQRATTEVSEKTCGTLRNQDGTFPLKGHMTGKVNAG